MSQTKHDHTSTGHDRPAAQAVSDLPEQDPAEGGEHIESFDIADTSGADDRPDKDGFDEGDAQR